MPFAYGVDAFSGLRVCPKCIVGRALPQTPLRELTAHPRPSTACCPLTKNLFPALGLRPQISRFPPRQISGYAHGFREQSKLLQRVLLERKGLKNTAVKHSFTSDYIFRM